MAIIMRNKTTIGGLVDDLALLNAADATEASTRAAADGDLTALSTSVKTNLVLAINSVKSDVDGLNTASNQAVTDEATARANADTALQTELDATQAGAGLAVDGAYVANGSANFIATAVSLNDADVKLDAALKAEEVRALAAEAALGVRIDNVLSNTDAAALDSLTEVVTAFQNADSNLTQAIQDLSAAATTDLDAEIAAREAADLVLQGNIDSNTAAITAEATRATTAEGVLTTNLAAEVAAREAAIAQEVIDRNEAIRIGGSLAKLESLTVSGGKITLTYEPKSGLNGVMNFGTVRYFDSSNGHSYDAPLVATANVKEFTVSTDTAGQWDGKSVQVQYVYVVPAV
jgi:hypothetical protein